MAKNNKRKRSLEDIQDNKEYIPTNSFYIKDGELADVEVYPDNRRIIKPKLNEEEWQNYWGNKGAEVVTKAQNEAALYGFALMSALGGNPIGAALSIAGQIAGEDLGFNLGGEKGRAIGGLIGGLAGIPIAENSFRIANNIKNRNAFAYKYITPFGYNNPIQRGKQFLKGILTEDVPSTSKNRYTLDVIKNIKEVQNKPEFFTKYRDAAFRKYLGLDEIDNVYVNNKNGTYSYNLDLVGNDIEKGLPYVLSNSTDVIADPIGNGGNVMSKLYDFGYGIGTDRNKKYSILNINDVWDLHPFNRNHNRLDTVIKTSISKKANKLYKQNYNKFYKYRFPYNYLGGKQLNKLRVGYYDKQLDKILKPIANKLANFEVGNILGGKPFVMDTDIPITSMINEDMTISNKVGMYADNILPQGYFDYKNGFKYSLNIDDGRHISDKIKLK